MADSINYASPTRSRPRSANERLDSWKEIASYLRRSVRTARRWELREGLPVRRHHHEQRGSVYAYRNEIDKWLGSREARLLLRRRNGDSGEISIERHLRLASEMAAKAQIQKAAVAAVDDTGAPNLEAILASSSDIICAYDRQGRYTLCSLSGARSVDGDREQMIGRTWRELGLPAEVMAPVERHLQDVFKSGRSVRASASYPTLSGPSHYEYILDPVRTDGSEEVVAVLAIVREVERNRR